MRFRQRYTSMQCTKIEAVAMLKTVLFSALLVAVCGDVLIPYYGEWVPAAVYIDASYQPSCTKFEIPRQNGVFECTCPDGRLTQLALWVDILDDRNLNLEYIPVTIVNGEPGSLTNVACKCGDDLYKSRGVIRSVGDNIILYAKPHGSVNKETTPTGAFVLARSTLNTSELQAVVQNIDELKNKQSKLICTATTLN